MELNLNSETFSIISGGQTGVDRGALDAALDAGVACGGWCPEDRRADDGPIDEKYPLQVLTGSGYRMRTKQNVVDTDATVIIYFGHIVLKGGTEQTLLECIEAEKPYLLIDAEEVADKRTGARIFEFVTNNKIKHLNIAGPKALGIPQSYQYTYNAILAFLNMQDNANA